MRLREYHDGCSGRNPTTADPGTGEVVDPKLPMTPALFADWDKGPSPVRAAIHRVPGLNSSGSKNAVLTRGSWESSIENGWRILEVE